MTLPLTPAVTPVASPADIFHRRAHRRPRDYRHDCNRLLFRGILQPGCYLEIRCPKCGRMAVFTFEPSNGKYEVESEQEKEGENG
jgi:phage FluMu protein Com